MKTDEPPSQDHRRHVEQFIGKRPPEGTQGQLENVGRYRDGEGQPYALSCENRTREYALEYFRHLVKRIRTRLVLPTPSNRVHRSSSSAPSPTAESAENRFHFAGQFRRTNITFRNADQSGLRKIGKYCGV